eukprot:TRINITY_DN4131_c0_g1_i1.p1 TRINITY_DN4131_c0_g1~~TRINITY_DN4131_c0_g1_i1.p1  ORF type:complete len:209 (-),score=14.90 TRINITY_DN4131_c0_g1_i1:314-940(-)
MLWPPITFLTLWTICLPYGKNTDIQEIPFAFCFPLLLFVRGGEKILTLFFSYLDSTWFPIENLSSVDAIHKYPGRALLMCWPHGYALHTLELHGRLGGKTAIIIGERCKSCDDSCITDDPFGGVDKTQDSQMMYEVRRIMGNIPICSTPFDQVQLQGLAHRYREAKRRWKLVEEVPIPIFVNTEDDVQICDVMCVYRYQNIESLDENM